MKQRLPIVEPGKRLIVIGRTGSGKTTLSKEIMRASPGSWVVIDQKHDKTFDEFPVVPLNRVFKELEKCEDRILVVRPLYLDPVDDFIQELHESFEGVGLYVDELYYIHDHGQPGPGLIGWLTRGRSREQSFIGCSQRPRWVSRFCFSESDYICTMSLSSEEDRKTMTGYTGAAENLQKLVKREFNWYDVDDDVLTEFAPLAMRKTR